jgi:CheY-like chemotaxis protein
MKSARILILDDDTAIAELLGEMISMLGYRPTSCECAERALNLLNSEEFDAVISDFQMPGLDGRQFFHRLQALNPALARRIIFLTGDTLNVDLQSLLKTSGSQCLPKPFRMNAIEDMLRHVLHGHAEEVLSKAATA